MRSLLLALVALLFATAALAQTYRVRPGDTLEITVLEDASLNRTVLVSPDGRISLPLAGTVRAAGRSVDQIQSVLASALESNFAARPNVFVSLGALAEDPEPEEPETINVFVVGEVNSPGLATVPAGTNLLQALAAAGGPSRFAATRRIQLRRADPRTGIESLSTFNYKAVLDGARVRGLFPLHDGDVIVVPERRLFE